MIGCYVDCVINMSNVGDLYVLGSSNCTKQNLDVGNSCLVTRASTLPTNSAELPIYSYM